MARKCLNEPDPKDARSKVDTTLPVLAAVAYGSICSYRMREVCLGSSSRWLYVCARVCPEQHRVIVPNHQPGVLVVQQCTAHHPALGVQPYSSFLRFCCSSLCAVIIRARDSSGNNRSRRTPDRWLFQDVLVDRPRCVRQDVRTSACFLYLSVFPMCR